MMGTRLRKPASPTFIGLLLMIVGIVFTLVPVPGEAQNDPPHAPRYQVDPSWPQPLPDNWLIGQVGGMAVDQQDNVWIVQRQRTLTNDEAWATEAIAFRCDDGEIVMTAGGCTDLSDPVPIDGLGNPRPDGPVADCCVPAPAIMQFDSNGNLLNAWGGPADPGFVGQADGIVDAVCDPDDGCQWPAGEHGLYVDHNGFVYLAGNGSGTGNCAGNPCPWAGTHGSDAMVVKFAADGTFIYQIGDPDPATAPDSNDTSGASNGTPQPFLPADMEVDPESNDLYIADGYGNHRVLVVDADTGLYERHWGAYGQNPVDDTGANDDPIGPDPNFKNPVHCVRIVGDLVYVCDRVNNRIQVFDKNVAGAPCSNPNQEVGVCGFLGEAFIAEETLGNGSTWDVDTSPDADESCLFNPDGTNQKVWILERETLEILDTFGRGGRSAGQFHWVHNLVVDSKGNLYTAEVDTGKRAQKFTRKGPRDCKV